MNATLVGQFDRKVNYKKNWIFTALYYLGEQKWTAGNQTHIKLLEIEEYF